MFYQLFILALTLCTLSKGEDPTFDVYEKLNTVEMIYNSQSFIINATETSIAYFNSFDRYSQIYISKDINDYLSQTDERITGKFIEIEPNIIYYVRIYLLSKDYTSNLVKYLYPKSLFEKSILIKGANINYLYLQKDKVYTLDLKEDTVNKRSIKLSRKTLNSTIIINDKELNDSNLYYQLEEDFRGELKLEVQNNNALIEFLTSSNETDFDKLTNVSLDKYNIIKNTNVIIINYTQNNFYITLSSDKSFNFSFSYGFSNDQNYFYNNIIPSMTPIRHDDYSYGYLLLVPYKDISFLTKDEFLSFTLKVEKELDQDVFISYRQISLFSALLDEKLDKAYCENVTNYLNELFDLYIFTDIAKNPPNVEGIENYHHKKIDIKRELSNVKTENRYFYEFYQEVMTIISTLKDLHLSLYAEYTPKKIPFIQYQVHLPFNFVIKQDTNEKFKLYIEINDKIKHFDEDIKALLEKCVDSPLKSINDIDPFDFIQNFNKFRTTKNKHAQFTYNINFFMHFFNLAESPLNITDFTYHEFEFENNIFIRINSLIAVPNMEDVEFNEFYLKYIHSMQNEMQMNLFKFPSFYDIKEKYLIYKGIKKEKKIKLKEEKIDWNITLFNEKNRNDYFKCRVDDENEVNVVVQTSFSLDYYIGILKILQCAKLFHANKYPIIIIESLNGGGTF